MTMNNIPYKIYLTEDEMPRQWYNVKADMKEQHPPFLNPATFQPAAAQDLEAVFCHEAVMQEFNTTERFIDIPEAIADFYKMYRPSPLVRAYCLEKLLDTPAHIYYKYEGTNTSGSHKLNSAVAQVYYAKQQGITSLTTETGAGQWGTALSMACSYFGVGCTVYMVKISAQQKPYRKAVMETYGAKVIASPSDTTEAGRKILAEDPASNGSLGCAISEAVEEAVKRDNCRYVLGSVLDHVILHQSIVGIETKTALEKYGIEPDIIIGCAGGGSNLGGLIGVFAGEKIQGKRNVKFIAAESASCPSLTKGAYAYDYCDTGRMTPLAKMYTLGAGFMPSSNHAGGLRYHGMSPIVSKLYYDGIIDEAVALTQAEIFEAATTFARIEGILPAPESAHAIKAAIDEALKCKESGEAKNIVFGLTGTGYFDMAAYIQYNEGKIIDTPVTREMVGSGLNSLPKVDF